MCTKTCRLFPPILFVITLGLLALSSLGASQGAITLLEQSFSGVQLRMTVQAADVEVVSGALDGIEVLARQQGGARGDFNISVQEEAGVVTIANDTSANPNARLSYLVRVPEETPLDLDVASGDVTINGVRADARVTCSSGNVSLERFEGNLEVLADGNVMLSHCQVASANVQSSTGNIRVRATSGSLKLHSAEGNISLCNVDDSEVHLSAEQGHIGFSGSLAPGSQSSIMQGSGNVTVSLPRSSSVQLRAQAEAGKVQSRFRLKDSSQTTQSLTGTLGDGQAQLTIELREGVIRIGPR